MPAGTFDDWVIEQEATFSGRFTYYNPDGETPIDLSSYTSARMEIRNDADTLILAFATSPAADEGTITLGGATGVVTLSASATLTEPLTPGEYYYDIFVYSSSENRRLLCGRITVVDRTTE